MNDHAPVRVLFVCMGNICRSPTAHGVFRTQVRHAGLESRIQVESAGTHGFHVGVPPDRRAVEAARARGHDLSGVRARQVEPADLEGSDYVLAMDRANLEVLQAMARGRDVTRPELLLDFVQDIPEREVPDPYYGTVNGFERVLDLVEAGCAGLLEEIRRRHDW